MNPHFGSTHRLSDLSALYATALQAAEAVRSPGVSAGQAQSPRVPHAAGATGLAAAAGPKPDLRARIENLRTAVDAFRDALHRQTRIPIKTAAATRALQGFMDKWVELDTQLEQLLDSDKSRLNDSNYKLRAQDTSVFLEPYGVTENELLSARPHSAKEKETKRSLADRLDGMTVKDAIQWVSEARTSASAALSAQGAAVLAPADQLGLTEEAARAVFEGSNAGVAVQSDPTFLPKLVEQLRLLTGKSGATVEDLLTGMSAADARNYLDRASEVLNLQVEHGALQNDQQHVDAMVQALGVTPMDVKGDGHCLYYALAKSADPTKAVNEVTAIAMRTELLNGVRGSMAQMRRITPQSGDLMAGLKAAKVIERIEAGAQSGAANSSAWGGPEEMQLYAMQNNRTVAFVSTQGGDLHTPDETIHIKDPVAFKEALDQQATADKARGRKPPLIVINRSDTHFQAAVYQPVRSEYERRLEVVREFANYSNLAQGVVEDKPQNKLKLAELRLKEAEASLKELEVGSNEKELNEALKLAETKLLEAAKKRDPAATLEGAKQKLDRNATWQAVQEAQNKVKADPGDAAAKQALDNAQKSLDLVDDVQRAQGALQGAQVKLATRSDRLKLARDGLAAARTARDDARKSASSVDPDLQAKKRELATSGGKLPDAYRSNMEKLGSAFADCAEAVVDLKWAVKSARHQDHPLEKFAAANGPLSLNAFTVEFRKTYTSTAVMTGNAIVGLLDKEADKNTPASKRESQIGVEHEFREFQNKERLMQAQLDTMIRELDTTLKQDQAKPFLNRMSAGDRDIAKRCMENLVRMKEAIHEPRGFLDDYRKEFNRLAEDYEAPVMLS